MKRTNSLRVMVEEINAKQLRAHRGIPWADRHVRLWEVPGCGGNPLKDMICGLASYCDQHYSLFDSPIGDDSMLSKSILHILKGLRGLLDGELGQFDAGTLDYTLCELAKKVGIRDISW